MLPDSVRDIGKRVEARIDELLVAETARWAAVDPNLADPLDALHRLALAGGKRLRPAFCLAAYVSAGGNEDDDAIVDAGAALELLHLFALIHDDVMDASDRRRNVPTVHVDFTARHGAARWRGEDRRFGEGVAILVGDLAFVYADLLLADAPRAALDLFTDLRLEVNVGQYLDLLGAVSADSDVATARRIALYKSGKYTVERPLHLGAALADRLDLVEPLSGYGVPLGEAFQLRDDVLGAFGDTALTGKPVGEDIREGKPTRLRAWATERTTGADARLLAARYGAADITAEDVATIQHLLVDSGALAAAETEIARLVAEAREALDKVDLAGEGRPRLQALADFVAHRAH
ncbi:MAG: polyprenyl synthetase family protein [Actinobacteria bacterium]|nr:polyprenyl synthetase family protein [Actinomycetota bacterium]